MREAILVSFQPSASEIIKYDARKFTSNDFIRTIYVSVPYTRQFPHWSVAELFFQMPGTCVTIFSPTSNLFGRQNTTFGECIRIYREQSNPVFANYRYSTSSTFFQYCNDKAIPEWNTTLTLVNKSIPYIGPRLCPDVKTQPLLHFQREPHGSRVDHRNKDSLHTFIGYSHWVGNLGN